MMTKFYKLIRVISIPPIVVSIMILILRINNYLTNLEALLLFIFLGLIQLIAYPISYLIPFFKKQGREGQRTLAFYIGIIGYSIGLIYAICAELPFKLEIIYFTYFNSIIILTFINKVLKVRASGHLTSITGPLVGLTYFMGPLLIIPSAIFYLLVFVSSLKLKRHTVKEMILGTLVVLVSFGLANLIMLI